ncbi:MAG: DUF4870 domain-containing protein [Anaerolineaceae bacterium]
MTGIPQTPSSPSAPLSPADERTWAMLAHLSTLLNLVTGILGPVAALIIYMIYKDRSRYVAYQSLQSLLMQLIAWIGGGIIAAVLWSIAGVLTVVVVGICLYPFAFVASLLPLAAIVYGIVGAVQTNQGQDFRYWLIGNWVRGTYTQ